MKRINFSLMLFIALVVISLCAALSNAATLEVGSGKPYTTIQSAINAAVNGDTVLVYNGTYVENIIYFIGKAITVKSVNGAASTIIDGNASGTVVTFGGGGVLDGFTIKNGYGDYYHGGVIYCNSSSPTITNCIITGNTAGSGGGIWCESSSPTITNCTITLNTAEDGGGIYCHESSPIITNCTISGNSAAGRWGCPIDGCYFWPGYGGGIYCLASSPIITNCTISGNRATWGGGIVGDSSSFPVVKNSILWRDIALLGKEIYLDKSLNITVTYSDVQGGWRGEGNIHANPMFVGRGNYHLRADSPCIDAGTADGAPDYDIDGDTRPQGAGYDMGSDEYTEED